MRKGWRLNKNPSERLPDWLRARFEAACHSKELGNPGGAYRQLKALSKTPRLTSTALIEIRLPMAVCLRLLGRTRASNTLFRQLLQQAIAAVKKDKELCLRIILDWSAALLDLGRVNQARVNLKPEFDKLSPLDELFPKAKAYLGRVYIREGNELGLVYITEAIPHLQGAMRNDAERWKLEAKAKMWRGGKQERRKHYEALHERFRQESPILALYTTVCYYTTFRLLRLMGILQGAVYVFKSMRPVG